MALNYNIPNKHWMIFLRRFTLEECIRVWNIEYCTRANSGKKMLIQLKMSLFSSNCLLGCFGGLKQYRFLKEELLDLLKLLQIVMLEIFHLKLSKGTEVEVSLWLFVVDFRRILNILDELFWICFSPLKLSLLSFIFKWAWHIPQCSFLTCFDGYHLLTFSICWCKFDLNGK